jgi:hypothetical protein
MLSVVSLAIAAILLVLTLLAASTDPGRQYMGTFRIATFSRLQRVCTKLSLPPAYACSRAPQRAAWPALSSDRLRIEPHICLPRAKPLPAPQPREAHSCLALSRRGDLRTRPLPPPPPVKACAKHGSPDASPPEAAPFCPPPCPANSRRATSELLPLFMSHFVLFRVCSQLRDAASAIEKGPYADCLLEGPWCLLSAVRGVE